MRKKKLKFDRKKKNLYLILLLFPLLFVAVLASGNAGNARTGQLRQVTSTPAAESMQPAASTKVYYENTVRDIVTKRCARCHSGTVRNLADYDNIKSYADSGMLRSMISPGGPMSRFAGSDSSTLLTWIDSGAPEKPPATAVNWRHMRGPYAQTGTFGRQPFPVDVPLSRITYTNTIQYIVARDCLDCHSGQFRNLTTYNKLKFYADNGLLKDLVQAGGQMHRFAGPDSRFILAWIANKAPQ